MLCITSLMFLDASLLWASWGVSSEPIYWPFSALNVSLYFSCGRGQQHSCVYSQATWNEEVRIRCFTFNIHHWGLQRLSLPRRSQDGPRHGWILRSSLWHVSCSASAMTNTQDGGETQTPGTKVRGEIVLKDRMQCSLPTSLMISWAFLTLTWSTDSAAIQPQPRIHSISALYTFCRQKARYQDMIDGGFYVFMSHK